MSDVGLGALLSEACEGETQREGGGNGLLMTTCQMNSNEEAVKAAWSARFSRAPA